MPTSHCGCMPQLYDTFGLVWSALTADHTQLPSCTHPVCLHTPPGMSGRPELNWPVQQHSWLSPQNWNALLPPTLSLSSVHCSCNKCLQSYTLSSICHCWLDGRPSMLFPAASCLQPCVLPTVGCCCQRRRHRPQWPLSGQQHHAVSTGGAPYLCVETGLQIRQRHTPCSQVNPVFSCSSFFCFSRSSFA